MRILLATTGSLGDLHPILAIGLGLQDRGHTAVIATSNLYRAKVIRTGLEFAPMGPHFAAPSPDFVRKVFHPVWGPGRLIRQMLYPGVPAAYAEVVDALRGCDLIVTHPITFAAQIAAEKLALPWVSTVTAPLSLPSRYDPPVYPTMPAVAKLRVLGPGVNGLLLALGRAVVRPWMKPITKFRASVGLPRGEDPIFNGQHAPGRVLAMFSKVMAKPQPDWPKQTQVIGFPFYDQAEHGQQLDGELERFLDAGPPPVVFTLGSSAVFDAGTFYRESAAAVKRLGRRGVLLVGANAIAGPLPTGTMASAYAPYSKVLPRAACVVHQGGIGTCGQALAAGRPMLVMPFAWDQPDNAARLERLGVARTVGRKAYTARRAADELDRLLTDASYRARAEEVARQVAAENAVGAACDAIEACAGACKDNVARTKRVF
jgi:UDP:flavonoid glycosyltransferase YjiC (YdhE family)